MGGEGGGHRGRGRVFALPLLLFALLFQALAPAAEARAEVQMAARAADPFAFLPICSPRTTGERDRPAGHEHQHPCALCGVCCVAHPGLAADAGPTLPAPSVEIALGAPFTSDIRPRGPPLLRARARGPPRLIG